MKGRQTSHPIRSLDNCLEMKVDIITLLPVEISIQIFEYLTPEDLCKCLGVSKKWRSIANCDVLWKKHCMKVNLPEHKKEEETPSDEFNLGTWAQSYITFGNSPAYKWYCNKYETLRLNSNRNDYCAFTTYGHYFAAFSKTHSNLDIYNIQRVEYESGWRTKIKLISSIDLWFPVGPWTISLHMTEKLLIAVISNIVIVFERSDGRYAMIKAIKTGFQQEVATRDLVKFVTKNFIPDFYVVVYGFIDGFLWLSLSRRVTTLVINVLTDELNTVLIYETAIVMGDYFVTWSPNLEEDLRVYDKRGNIAVLLESVPIFLESVPCVEDASVNPTLFSFLCASMTFHGMEGAFVNVWELSSGRHIFFKRMPTVTWSKLHPSKEILYTLESSLSDEIFQINSWDVRAGCKLWMYEDNGGSYVTIYRELTEVCGKYLIIWPTKNGKEKFICLETETGKLVYESDRPYGEEYQFNKITDTFWLAVTYPPVDLTVRSYF